MNRTFVDPVLRTIRSSNERVEERRKFNSERAAEKYPDRRFAPPLHLVVRQLSADERRNHYLSAAITGVVLAAIIVPLGSTLVDGTASGTVAHVVVGLLTIAVITALVRPVRLMFKDMVPNHPSASGVLHGAMFVAVPTAILYVAPLVARLFS